MPARIYKQPDARLHTLKRVIQGIVVAFILFLLWLKYLDSQLPDVGMLNDVHLQLPMRVYTADNKLMGEFGEIHRIPVTLDQIPTQIIQATLATEDHRFFEHEGVDMLGLLRAAIQVAITGKKSQGGSTITMQVARNFFLSRQKTYTRKLKEILLADREGRYLQIDYPKLSIASLYMPSGTSGEHRQAVKFEFLEHYEKHLKKMLSKNRDYIICGDWNIAHTKMDLKNWQSNQNTSGFLPEERAWMDKLFNELGYVDAFRVVNQEPDQYTWWSSRSKTAFEKNVGWRIDYQVITPGLKDKVRSASICREKQFSDHAPLTLVYDLDL